MIDFNIISLITSQEAVQLAVAAILGGLIGLERELAGKDPSLRTFSLICLGSCLFSMVSHQVGMSEGEGPADPGRIAAQIVTGIGFIGAGAIFRRNTTSVSGLTTAALMWVTAAIGMAIGFNLVDLAILATTISFITVYTLQLVHYLIRRFKGNPLRADEIE